MLSFPTSTPLLSLLAPIPLLVSVRLPSSKRERTLSPTSYLIVGVDSQTAHLYEESSCGVAIVNCSVSCLLFHCPTGQSGDFSDGAGHDSVQLSSRLSESSDDSFHSTVEHIDISVS